MTKLENKNEDIRQSISEMMHLVRSQLLKSKVTLFSLDKVVAQEINSTEHRVNAYELNIDKKCENALALLNPVAHDLRFILSSFKINSIVERIGDHANGIATYVNKDAFKNGVNPKVLEAFQIETMFDIVLSMFSDATSCYENDNTQVARWIFGKDKTLNEIDRNNVGNLVSIVNNDKVKLDESLVYLSSISKKMERIGDLTKNIAEEVIFYVEASTPKHEGKIDRSEIV